jgi:hypothetical protein
MDFGPLTVVVSPACAFAGVWLGWFLNGRAENHRWQRDVKKDAYLAFLQAADSAQAAEARLLDLAMQEAPDEVQDAARENLRAASDRMENACSVVTFFGVPEVLQAVLLLTGPARPTAQVNIWSRQPAPARDLVQAALDATIERRTALLIAMQRDLKQNLRR